MEFHHPIMNTLWSHGGRTKIKKTYKNYVMPHGKHIFKTASDMYMETICAYPPSKYALTHWKCVLWCCAQFPYIDIPSPESDQHNSHVSPTMGFCVYHLIARCTVQGICPFNEKKQWRFYEDYSYSIVTEKQYKRNYLVMMKA